MLSTKTLHEAVVNRDVALIKRIFEGEGGWKSMDDQGETVLHLVFKCQLRSFFLEESIIETLECLLDEGLSVNLKNAAGQTVLFLAVENRLHRVTDFLVQNGANVDTRDQDGNSMIHLMIMEQSKNYSNRDPTFQEFIEQDHINSIAWLLSTGVNVHLRNNDGKSAFNLAIQQNLKHILPILIKHMNNVNYVVEDGSTVVKSIFQTGGYRNTKYNVEIIDSLLAFLDHVDKKGSTLVHAFLKSCNRNFGIIRRILPRYTNVNAQDQDGNTALHLVINNGYFKWPPNQQHTIDTIRTLLTKGAKVNLKNHTGESPICLAFQFKHAKVLKALLDHGADVSPSTHPRAHFLHHISNVPSNEDKMWAPMVDTFVQAGWDVNEVRSGDEFTPLMEACRRCRPAIAQKLINNSANVNYVEKGNLMRPIHVAAMLGHTNEYTNAAALFKMLVKAGAKVNAKNKRGETALHLASHFCYRTVERLLCLGANVDAKNEEGRLPLHVAIKEINVVAIKALLIYGAEVNDVDILREVNELSTIEQVDDEIQVLAGPNLNPAVQKKNKR